MSKNFAIVCIVGIAVYTNSLGNGFHYDDEHSILRNPSIRDPLNIPAFFIDTSYFSIDENKGMYRPVLLITYVFNYFINGLEGKTYHIVNLGFHLVCSCFVMWIARFLAGGRGTLIAGMLFVLHPANTEVVNYVSSRSESLAALFYLLAVGLFLRYERDRLTRYKVGCYAAFALGLLSKSIVITFPLVTCLFIKNISDCSKRFVDKTAIKFWKHIVSCIRQYPFFWLVGIGYIFWISSIGFLGKSLIGAPRGFSTQILTQVKAIVYYGQLFCFPVSLNVEPQFLSANWASWPATLFSTAFAVSLCFFVTRSRKLLPLSVVWAGIVLLPTIIVPLNVLVNEHRFYLSCAALCIGIGHLVSNLKFSGCRILIITLFVISGSHVVQRNQVWAEDLTLWKGAVDSGPLMPRSYLYLGDAYRDKAHGSNDIETSFQYVSDARRAYKRALELEPNLSLKARALTSLAILDTEQGKLDSARVNLERVLQLDPKNVDAIINLGNVFFRFAREHYSDRNATKNYLHRAGDLYKKASDIHPKRFEAHLNLGAVSQALGKFMEAENAYQQALFLNPGSGIIWRNLGTLHMQIARVSAGKKAFESWTVARRYLLRAKEIHPTHLDILRALKETENAIGVSSQ